MTCERDDGGFEQLMLKNPQKDCIIFLESNKKRVVLNHRASGKTMISAGDGGIINKDAGADIFPRGIGLENELIGYYLPHELKSMNLNPEGKLHSIAENLKDDDNPVVVVVDLKG